MRARGRARGGDQNGNIFVDIEGFRPCLSKPSYRAPKYALMVRLLQKERLKSPQKSLIIENQAFGSFWQFCPKCDVGLLLLHDKSRWLLRTSAKQENRRRGGRASQATTHAPHSFHCAHFDYFELEHY